MLPIAALVPAFALGRFAQPLATIELPWNPDLTQIPTMTLFYGLIALTFIVLGVLYFYKKKSSGPAD